MSTSGLNNGYVPLQNITTFDASDSITTNNITTNNLTVNSQLSMPYLPAQSILINDVLQNVSTATLSQDQFLYGSPPGLLAGKLVNMDGNISIKHPFDDDFSIDLKSSIGITGSAKLGALTPSSLVSTDSSSTLQSVIVANTSGCNSSLSSDGTTLTFAMDQDLSTSGTPTFESMTLTNTNNVGSNLIPLTDNTYTLGSSSKAWSAVYTDAIVNPSFSNNAFVYTVAPSGALNSTTNASNGDLLIGTTLNPPQKGTLTNTDSNVVITYVNPNLQINTATSPSFSGTVSGSTFLGTGLTASKLIGTNSSKQLQSLNISNSSFNGNNSTLSLSGTTLTLAASNDTSAIVQFAAMDLTNVTNPLALGNTTLNTTAVSPNTLTLPTSTDTLVGKNTTDTLTNKTLTSPVINTPTIAYGTANTMAYFNSSKDLTQTANPTNGQLLIGSTSSSPVLGTIGAGSNIGVTNGSGTISIATSSTPSFTSETLTATTNQLVLGTTKTTTISCVAPVTSQTITIPDGGASSNMVLDQGNYNIAGRWVFEGTITLTPTTNQLVIEPSGSGNKFTFTATNPAANRTITIPDPSANANMVLDHGATTISGAWTFNSTLATANSTLDDGSGNMTIGTSGSGITLYSNGNTGSKLSWYKTVNFASGAATVSGPWAVAKNIPNFTITRIGNVVTVYIETVNQTATTATFITVNQAVPSWAFPNTTFGEWLVPVSTSGTTTTGSILMDSSGNIKIYASPAQGNFSGSGNNGFPDIYFSYITFAA